MIADDLHIYLTLRHFVMRPSGDNGSHCFTLQTFSLVFPVSVLSVLSMFQELPVICLSDLQIHLNSASLCLFDNNYVASSTLRILVQSKYKAQTQLDRLTVFESVSKPYIKMSIYLVMHPQLQ